MNAPLGLVLLFLTGVGPVIAWRRATPETSGGHSSRRRLALALRSRGCRSPACAHVLGGVSSRSASSSLATIVQEFWRGMRRAAGPAAREPPRGARGLVGKNRRRYGGYIIHVGIVIAFLGVAGDGFNGKSRCCCALDSNRPLAASRCGTTAWT